MKKIRSIFVLAVLAAVLVFTAFGAKTPENNGVALNYNLTCDGENVVTVENGDVITVVYTLENGTSNDDYRITSVTNEISFDNSFFEFVDGSIEKNDCSNSAVLQKKSKNDYRVYFNFSSGTSSAKLFGANQKIGSFKLKVTAEEGQSVIRSRSITAFDENGDVYTCKATDLTVMIGEETELFDVVYKNGENVVSSSKSSGIIKVTAAPKASAGETFKGWCNVKTNTTYNPGDNFEVTENTTFEAVWEKSTATLTFVVNGGSEISSLTKEYGSKVVLSDCEKTTRNGYTFKGWYSDSALKNQVESVTLNGDVTVYAKWEKKSGGGGGGGGGSSDDKDDEKTFTLSFETNGGEAVSSVKDIKKDAVIELSAYVTEKDGAVFEGWCSDKELSNIVSQITITSDTTVYAKWNDSEKENDNKGHVHFPDYRPEIFTKEHIAYLVGREDGNVDPDACLTRAEAAEIFYRLLTDEVREKAQTAENDFDDVNEGDWFNTSVSTLARLEIIKGRGNGSFAPKDNITRAELTTIIARLVEAEYDGEDLFEDIAGHWANEYINVAASIGWVKGYEGKFRPNDHITRAEVVTLINRALNRQPESRDDLLDEMLTPPDNANEDAWYYLAIQEAVNGHTYTEKEDGVHEKWVALSDGTNGSFDKKLDE